MLEYTISGRFAPTRSLLGKLISVFSRDRLRAEAIYLISAVLVALVLIFVFYADLAGLRTAAAWKLSAIEVLGVSGFVIFTIVGFRPTIKVCWSEKGLEVQAGPRKSLIRCEDIVRAEIAESTAYYRTLHRQSNIVEYINTYFETVLIVETKTDLVSIGLREHEQRELQKQIERLTQQSVIKNQLQVA